jgi:hypothetical protein
MIITTPGRNALYFRDDELAAKNRNENESACHHWGAQSNLQSKRLSSGIGAIVCVENKSSIRRTIAGVVGFRANGVDSAENHKNHKKCNGDEHLNLEKK